MSRGGRLNIVSGVTYTVEDLHVRCIYMSSLKPVLHLGGDTYLLKRKLIYSINRSFGLKFL